LNPLPIDESADLMIDRLKRTKTNAEFLLSMSKGDLK